MLRVNMNGSPKNALVDQRIDLINALRAAMEALQIIAPHGRDYQTAPQGEYERDRAVYTERFAMLDKLCNEIQDEALAIHDQ